MARTDPYPGSDHEIAADRLAEGTASEALAAETLDSFANQSWDGDL